MAGSENDFTPREYLLRVKVFLVIVATLVLINLLVGLFSIPLLDSSSLGGFLRISTRRICWGWVVYLTLRLILNKKYRLPAGLLGIVFFSFFYAMKLRYAVFGSAAALPYSYHSIFMRRYADGATTIAILIYGGCMLTAAIALENDTFGKTLEKLRSIRIGA